MYVLSAIRVCGLLGVLVRVGRKISVFLNLCCDCGCGRHNKLRYVMLRVVWGVVVLLACLTMYECSLVAKLYI